MKKVTKACTTGVSFRIPLRKPGMFSLFANIARATLSGGMLWFVFFGGMLVAFLHVNHFPAEQLLALLITVVAVTGFVRGIRDWQHELDKYQRDLTEYRMNMADTRNKHQVKKNIIWDRQ